MLNSSEIQRKVLVLKIQLFPVSFAYPGKFLFLFLKF
jgi:hypothetical protein